MAPEAEQVRIRFATSDGLNAFCQELRDNDCGYSLAGHRSVVLSRSGWRQVERLHFGSLKDYKPEIEPVVAYESVSAQDRAEAVRHRLMPTAKVLENIRARLAKLT